MARANLNGLLYQGEEEGRVLGVLEVQEEARRIERLWERSLIFFVTIIVNNFFLDLYTHVYCNVKP